jgi:hypothetical protein
MKPNRQQRALTAWVLYFSILFGALACAIAHGQLAAAQLAGFGGQFCLIESGDPDPGNANAASAGTTTGSSCALTSSFAAVLLAALFGLLGLLVLPPPTPLPAIQRQRTVRDRWPSANPRASPSLLPLR